MNITPDNLINCDKEPIHIPGKIQNHGFLIVLDPADFTIIQVSNNVNTFLSIDADALLNQKIDVLPFSGLKEIISVGLNNKSFDDFNPTKLLVNKEELTTSFNLITHKNVDGLLILEFELSTENEGREDDFKKVLLSSIDNIQGSKDLRELVTNTAVQIKKLTGYDRVMVYRFHEDWHGEVIAESKEDHLESFYGLHYPASDIPKQARELFKKNLVREIADINSEAAQLHPLIIPEIDRSTDLSDSVLRSSSPIHLEYLTNMGVNASLTISLLKDDELWGMIACHHYSPKHINFNFRHTCKFISQLFSSALVLRAENENFQYTERSKKIASNLHEKLMVDWDVMKGLSEHHNTLKDMIECDGAAIVYEGKVKLIGNVPNEDSVQKFCKWLSVNSNENVFESREICQYYSEDKDFTDKVCGVLAACLSKELSEYILWFKKEVIQEVYWGGNPNKPVEFDENGSFRVSPRKSFEKWREEVKGKSKPWKRADIVNVSILREDVIHIIAQKANEIRRLNEKLSKAYKELDAFSYTVSHDLKTPLTAIKAYTEIMIEDYGEEVNDDLRDLMNKVLQNSEKMHVLIKEILHYSRVGKDKIARNDIDVIQIVEDIVSDIEASNKKNKTEFIIGDLPKISGDETMLKQVFYNLLSNANKYSSKKEKPKIIIEAIEKPDEVVFTIEDNGIGIDMKYFEKVYNIFYRVTTDEDFEGTGVGLSITKRMIEKHNGKIWFESKLNQGTTFYVSLPKPIED